jgi:hypothetical protein
MEYEKRIVCYFDILGFGKNVIENNLTANIIQKLFNEIGYIINEYEQEQIQISHFSDSVVISIKNISKSATQLKFILDILIKLLEYKLTARGAMVYGEIIHTKENVYGPALVMAVKLEKENAIYPRIILDKSLDEEYLPTIGNARINHRAFFNNFKYVKTDIIDNEFYIDYISEISKKNVNIIVRENIEELIRIGINDESLYEKYNWIKIKYYDLIKNESNSKLI